jgi:hypothetical protein
MHYTVVIRGGRALLVRSGHPLKGGTRGSAQPEGYQVVDRGGILCLRRKSSLKSSYQSNG